MYTTYLVDPSGRVRLGEKVERPDDAAAIAYLRNVDRGGEAAELWQGGRLVARQDADGALFLGGG
jgi:hypothetical protein